MPVGSRLRDVDERGRERNWKGKKMANELLAAAYDSVDKRKAERLRECGSFLAYRVYDDGSKRLESMTSCRVRLCPICTWRRSLKVFAQTTEIVEFAAKELDLRYIMLTLTVKSCKGDTLDRTLDDMLCAWKRFVSRREVSRLFVDGRTKETCGGWYRSLEITHDCYPQITPEMYYGDKARHIYSRRDYYDSLGLRPGDDNPAYDTYHPHFHVLIAVRPSYFTSRNYLSAERWATLWAESLRLDYTPVVDVRKVRGNTMDDLNKAVAEVAKYACKDADFIVPDDWDLTVDTVRTLDQALNGRKLIAYGGLLRQVKALLKQDDVDTGDLIHLDGEDKPEDQNYRIVCFWWWSGYRDYFSEGEA